MTHLFRFAALAILLTACGSVKRIQTPAVLPTVAVIPTFTRMPTVMPSPSATAMTAMTPTATPLPFEMYPYTIDGLRERQYSGSAVNIITALAETGFYTRYLVSYLSDGLTITGIMQVPPGEGPFPVILLNHGYFNRWAYESGDGTDRLAETLNRAGYLTIASDYRSWGGSDVGPIFFYSGPVIDVMNLLASLPSIPQADVNRVGMLGHSMGGGVTLKVLTIDSGKHIRAAVLYAPVSADDADIIARWGTGCIGTTAIENCNSTDILPETVPLDTVEAYLRAADDPAILHKLSPLYYLDLVNVPVQIHIGAADGQYIGGVPPEWSQKIFDELIAVGKPAELFLYQGQSHSFVSAGRDLFLQRILEFFDIQVKGNG